MRTDAVVRCWATLISLAVPAVLGAQQSSKSRDAYEHANGHTTEQLGSIRWPTSASPATHALFIKGVLYMHNFHYDEAADAFQQAQKRDPGDVVSYWGEATSYTHPIWNEQDTSAHPEHPGAAHYVIHAVDDPDHARLGLRAARSYSRIASSAGHALHMTSHIFVALGMWDDVVTANEKSQATIPFLSSHVVTWLGYGLIQQGRYAELVMRSLPRSGSAQTRVSTP